MKATAIIRPRRAQVELPIGTVRVRPNKTDASKSHRVIKYRMGGKPGLRWMTLARWWWQQNRGPIPAGMIVLHEDGDTMNDNPANLILGKPGDNIACWAMAKPDRWDRVVEKMRQGTIEHNKLRGELRRLTSWLPTRWYPVDHAARVVYNKPQRSRWQVYGSIGVLAPVAVNGGGCDSAALGWPGRPFLQAVVLVALVDGPLDGESLYRRVEHLRAERDEPPLSGPAAIYQATSPLGKAGLISVARAGRNPATYRLTPKAVVARGPFTLCVPVRGRDIMAERYEEYEKVDPRRERRRRVSPIESLGAIASAMAGGGAA